DGIRDRNVTGVQTCALPISNSFFNSSFVAINYSLSDIMNVFPISAVPIPCGELGCDNIQCYNSSWILQCREYCFTNKYCLLWWVCFLNIQIGRASCK